MTNHQSLRGHPITNSEVAQTAQHLPSAATKLLNEARLELAIIIRDNIYQSKCLQELLYAEVPELVTKLNSLTAELKQAGQMESLWATTPDIWADFVAILAGAPYECSSNDTRAGV